MDLFIRILYEAWHLLLESSIYILLGLLVSGVLRVFLSPHTVAKHLGQGRFRSVFKAALIGIPIPLCSCGVLPAAASLKKQGANNGATTAFLISTPESGVDSIAVTYALLDPIMTVVRPISAFLMGTFAGITENMFSPKTELKPIQTDLSCPVDGCCDGKVCSPEEHNRHHTFAEKITAGVKFAFSDVWNDLAGWFFVGLILAGIISALIPDEVMQQYLGGGISSMLLMLVIGIPIYICATASTPVAAALILKGVSPGAALVFLLAGPATNVTSLTVLLRILGPRATAIYLSSIALFSVLFGLAVDQIYASIGISPLAVMGQASEALPDWVALAGVIMLLFFSIKPVFNSARNLLRRSSHTEDHDRHVQEEKVPEGPHPVIAEKPT